MSKIHIVGAGPGHADYLLPRARQILAETEVLIAGQRLLKEYGHQGQKKVPITADLQPVLDCIKENMNKRKTTVLVSGDPGLYSFLNYLKKQLPEKEMEVIPGISALQLAFAHSKMSWQEAEIISLHGKDNFPKLAAAVRAGKTVGLFTDDKNSPGRIAKFLLARGIRNRCVHVYENLSYPGGNSFKGSLKGAGKRDFASLSVMIIFSGQDSNMEVNTSHRGSWGGYWVPGIPDHKFVRGEVPMTGEEIRTITISKLNPAVDSIIYDVGAGTGSLTVEAALQAEAGQVLAVEKKPEARQLIEKNIDRFDLDNVEIVSGEAPSALSDLPRPDGVIIGGSGGRLGEILSAVNKKLFPGGRIVINAVTLDTLSEARKVLAKLDYEVSICQLNVSHSKEIAGYQMMKALNPVNVITAKKHHRK